MAIPEFESGKRYRLRYRTAGTRADREAVAVYVDRSRDSSDLFFAGGSVYGGLTLRTRDTEILSAVLNDRPVRATPDCQGVRRQGRAREARLRAR